jgi:acyl-CoA synthetase (AMP-forming)/AMP-acid ligase II
MADDQLNRDEEGRHVDITLFLEMAADGFPDRVVVSNSEGSISATDLRERAWRAAALVRGGEFDSVVYVGPTGPVFPVSLFGAAYAGVPFVPLNFRLGDASLREQ